MTSTRYTYEQRWRMALEPPVYDDGKRRTPDEGADVGAADPTIPRIPTGKLTTTKDIG